MHPIPSVIQRTPNPCRAGRPQRSRGLPESLWRGGFAALLGAISVAATAAVVAPPWPAVVDPTSDEHHVGKVIFVELVTPDIDAAERFYGGLLGWTFRDVPTGAARYAQASLAGQPVAGLVHKPIRTGERRQPAWVGFIAVQDVDAVKTLALGQGARVLAEPHDLAGRGREAVFADPQGAVFAVLASSSGDPPDVLATPGEWIWRSLLTTDLDAGTAFYQSVFDYEVFELPDSGGAGHVMLATEDYARASANAMPAAWKSGQPHWLHYVRVDDAVASAARAVALGGRVLVEPHADRHGGKVAVIADPQGAPFGLLEWPGVQISREAP